MMNPEQREAIQAAIEAEDYDAWKELHANSPMLEKIDTEDKFEKLVEMYEHKEQARIIAEEL